MGDDAVVVRDEIDAYNDGTIARVRVLSVPDSDRFPAGIKDAFHYGDAGASHPSSGSTTITPSTNYISRRQPSRSTSLGSSPSTGPGGLRCRPKSAPTGNNTCPNP